MTAACFAQPVVARKIGMQSVCSGIDPKFEFTKW